MNVDGKAWPKFDGTGPLDTFLTKVAYFMRITNMEEDEKMPKLVELLKGRAFNWLSHQPQWVELEYQEIVALMQKEYGAMKTRDLACLEKLKCGIDITKFNEEFNKIG